MATSSGSVGKFIPGQEDWTQYAKWLDPFLTANGIVGDERKKVVLLMSNQSICVCGSFKKTVNRASRVDCYPLPKVEDLFAMLSRGSIFSKLDLSQAYQQDVLKEASCLFTDLVLEFTSFFCCNIAMAIFIASALLPTAIFTVFDSVGQSYSFVHVYVCCSLEYTQYTATIPSW